MTERQSQVGILGVHPGALGDVILFGQILSALRVACGGPVRLAARGERGALLVALGVADEALDFDALPFEEVFAEPAPARGRLPDRLGACRLLVSTFAGGDEKAQWRLARLCSAERSLFLPTRPPEGFHGHLVDYWARQARVESVPVPSWSVPAEWRRQAGRALAEAGADPDRAYVVIHPGSGSPAKCWPLERFIAVGRSVAPRRRGQCVFALGPAEEDWWGPGAIADIRGQFPTLVSPPLAVLAGVLAGASGFVGNDSGPTHLAAAVGTATAAIFGPTDPVQFAPRGRCVRTIHRPALINITVADVLAALDALAPGATGQER